MILGLNRLVLLTTRMNFASAVALPKKNSSAISIIANSKNPKTKYPKIRWSPMMLISSPWPEERVEIGLDKGLSFN